MNKLKTVSSLRVFLWGVRLYLRRHKKPILTFLLVGLALFFSFNKRSLKISTRTPVFKVGFVAQATSPTSLPRPVTRLLSSGLTAPTPDGGVVADLAQRWEHNEEGSEFTFFLKPDLYWQDQTKLVNSDLKLDLANVSVSYPAEDQITFGLKNPFSPFPILLSQAVFKQDTFWGTGPCQVAKVERKKEIITRLIASCPSQDSLLDLRFYPNKEDARFALELGEIRALWGWEKGEEGQTLPGFNFYPQEADERFVAVFYNFNDSFLSEKEVRQALSLAVPKQDFPRRAFGPISPSSWAYNPDLKRYDLDLEAAGELLAERESPSHLQLWTTPVYQQLAEKIAASWQKLGIPTQVEVKTGDESSLKGFQTLLVGQEIPPDPDQYSLWHSTQETNITGLKSPRIDKYLEDGRATFDQEKRKKIYQDFQKYLVEECAAAFLYYPQEYILVSQKIDTAIFHEVFKIEEQKE